ncbi:uncharacterized protein LOC122262166 [Penaeus japonicus]|uniref:uncharacterized protein LOC122262166 n=1 Tax=Penaeus japonicus TaxID=27405 RepID=UPI001C70B6BC|nr:uncharacterized protein LOC122262166 [Penaeus japonicus]
MKVQVLVLAASMGAALSTPNPTTRHRISSSRRSSATSAQEDQIFLLATLAGAADASPGYLHENDITNHRISHHRESPKLSPAHSKSPVMKIPYISSPGFSVFARATLPKNSQNPVTPHKTRGLTSRLDSQLKHRSSSLKQFSPSSNAPKTLAAAHKIRSHPNPAHANRHRIAVTQKTLLPPTPTAIRGLVDNSPLPRNAFPEQGRQDDIQYSVQYAVKDDLSGNHFGHQEDRDGYRTQGIYYVQLPDDRVQKVTYYVDGKSGFVAQVTYERKPQ